MAQYFDCIKDDLAVNSGFNYVGYIGFNYVERLRTFFNALRDRPCIHQTVNLRIESSLFSEELIAALPDEEIRTTIPNELLHFWLGGSGGCFCSAQLDLDAERNNDLAMIAGRSDPLVFMVQIMSPDEVYSVWSLVREKKAKGPSSADGSLLDNVPNASESSDWIPFCKWDTNQYLALQRLEGRKHAAVVHVKLSEDPVHRYCTEREFVSWDFYSLLESWENLSYLHPLRVIEILRPTRTGWIDGLHPIASSLHTAVLYRGNN